VIEPFGDAAVQVTLGAGIDEETSRRVHALAGAIRTQRAADDRIGTPVPGFTTVLVPFDPFRLDPAGAADLLAPLIDAAERAALAADEEAPVIELPTTYGGPDGPDLDEVAALHGLSTPAAIELHASTVYRVAFIGFLPGFAYLGTVPAGIATPRRATPRERVPAGSVGIADRQTAVYPFASPGGWQLIGRTERTVWDPRRDPPALLEPGRRVRFVPLPR
jgi:KipI family sensor histidine kinase inhibitor